MEFIIIFDTGKQYVYYYDPKDKPEWINRSGYERKINEFSF